MEDLFIFVTLLIVIECPNGYVAFQMNLAIAVHLFKKNIYFLVIFLAKSI